MKKILFAGSALVALGAVPALAEQGQASHGRFAQPQTRAEAEARAQERFVRADANGDGFITQEEVAARAEAGSGGGMGRMGGRGFAAMDSDGDGRVTLADAQRAALERFDRVDSNRDGTISAEERQAAREAWRERRQERQGE